MPEKLYNNFILRYDFPQRIHSDQGADFINNLFSNLLKISGVKQSRTTTYHFSGNGQTEQFNRTPISILHTLTVTKKSNWKQSLPKLVHAYSCTRRDAIGYPPYFISILSQSTFTDQSHFVRDREGSLKMPTVC